ncbi:MAG: hypothetical protein KKG33_05810 [candidate division Zixibacteria bacterium]|nr:hypothetical protein [candidate division Zixibacteria bacterium]MBU1471022.1 hypothetical protein [candidate division Zixibacteria bacterium]MBU2625057.1 hypothetical protein [candidate division Zixibacteria bacterium]
MGFWNKMLMIDRRWIFLLVGLSLLIPMFLSSDFKLSISDEVRGIFDAMEKLPPGSRVLMTFDYDPPSAPELQPMADAAVRYCFKKDLKIIIMGLWPQGPQQAEMSLQRAFEVPEIAAKNLQYGVDYVNLGFQAGNEFVIQRMGTDFKEAFPKDVRGTVYEDIPMLKNVKNFSNVDFVFNLSAGYPGTVEWVQIAADRFDVLLGAGNTAVQAPLAYPYLGGGQLVGLLGGMRGGAEFEKVTGFKAKATTFMLSQTFAHGIVIFFVVIGNIAYFMTRGRQE